MEEWAIVSINGVQHQVNLNDEVIADRLEGKKGKKLAFDQVLLVVDGAKITIGQPTIKGASVKAEIIEQFKGKKIRVATYKAKSRYRRVKGFRPHLTRLKITQITV